ncbi:hypothetical protein HD554DRAFT_2084916 [Boletus coccyginus]|nr:hypothetical protein HD554DRAFT_2084916 [Boletus coccyginus]
MSFFNGLAGKALSAATGGSSEASKTGGQEYNSPHNNLKQQPQGGGYDTEEVLSHADVDEESKGYIKNAIQHVQDNSQAHNEQVDESDLAKYGPLILKALSSSGSSSGSGSGINIGSLLSGLGGSGSGGNQLMGLVMKEAEKAVSGGGSEDKQSALNDAAMTLTKLVTQGQLSALIGGSNSGGLDMLGVGKSLLKSGFA